MIDPYLIIERNYYKAQRVIESCKTKEHIAAAYRYVILFSERHGSAGFFFRDLYVRVMSKEAKINHQNN